MLRIQLSAFEQVIHRLQDELARRAKSEADTAKTIESLSREIELLRQQLQFATRASAKRQRRDSRTRRMINQTPFCEIDYFALAMNAAIRSSPASKSLIAAAYDMRM